METPHVGHVAASVYYLHGLEVCVCVHGFPVKYYVTTF